MEEVSDQAHDERPSQPNILPPPTDPQSYQNNPFNYSFRQSWIQMDDDLEDLRLHVEQLIKKIHKDLLNNTNIPVLNNMHSQAISALRKDIDKIEFRAGMMPEKDQHNNYNSEKVKEYFYLTRELLASLKKDNHGPVRINDIKMEWVMLLFNNDDRQFNKKLINAPIQMIRNYVRISKRYRSVDKRVAKEVFRQVVCSLLCDEKWILQKVFKAKFKKDNQATYRPFFERYLRYLCKELKDNGHLGLRTVTREKIYQNKSTIQQRKLDRGNYHSYLISRESERINTGL